MRYIVSSHYITIHFSISEVSLENNHGWCITVSWKCSIGSVCDDEEADAEWDFPKRLMNKAPMAVPAINLPIPLDVPWLAAFDKSSFNQRFLVYRQLDADTIVIASCKNHYE